MIGFCPLASGSKGNSIYLGTEETKILIDAGISTRMLLKRLAEINVAIEEIDAIIVTHDHSDHIKGIPLLSKRYNIPVLANSDTAKGIFATTDEQIQFKIFSTGETFEFGDLEIHPFSIQHDTLDPVAFTIKTNGLKLGICADLGFVTTLVASHLQRCDYLYIEANHQPSMVHACNRPMVYKQRVLGRQGHLSNQHCAELIAEILHPHLKHIYLAHLSSECNNPDLALKIVGQKLEEHNMETGLTIAYQDQISKILNFTNSVSQVN